MATTTNIEELEIINGDLTAKVGDESKRLFPKTKSANVQFTTKDGTTTDLATVVATIITELESTATTSNMETAIETAVTATMDKLVDGAPEALNTLKELAEKATENSDLLTDLKEISTGKVDKEDGKELISSVLLAILSTIDNDKIAAWDKAEANKLESVSVNDVAQTITNKGVNISVPVISVANSVPDNMKSGDICFVTSD